MTASRDGEGGFSLVEASVVISVMVIGVLGLLSAMVSAQMLSRTTREMDEASMALVEAVEVFRSDCSDDFDGAVDAVISGGALFPPGPGRNTRLWRTVVSDETAISPPIDLNGDGDLLDTAVAVADADAAVVVFKITWRGARGAREVEYTVVVSRPGGTP
ncbi:MAG: hypothetical protein AAF628_16695 [Planctomycetota bacterium]